MPLNIRSEEELQLLDGAQPLKERLRPLQDRVMARPATGQEADKAFYDALSRDPLCSLMRPAHRLPVHR
ncbi:MAG TPA: hypothetical protein VNW90_26365 [Acetobacteraceae bacterium]|nr:hypothetical protein [Acetobacteraceae bacterium]